MLMADHRQIDATKATGGLTGCSSRYGSIRKVTNDEWCVDIYRTPTRMSPEEKIFSEQCRGTEPPATYRRNYHSPSMPQMLRCPIGGGSCKNGLINVRNAKAAVNSHFNLHHRSRGKFFHLKLEGAANAFTYTTFPLKKAPTDVQGMGTFGGVGKQGEAMESPGAGSETNNQPLITTLMSDRNLVAAPVRGMERLRPPKKKPNSTQ